MIYMFMYSGILKCFLYIKVCAFLPWYYFKSFGLTSTLKCLFLFYYTGTPELHCKLAGIFLENIKPVFSFLFYDWKVKWKHLKLYDLIHRTQRIILGACSSLFEGNLHFKRGIFKFFGNYTSYDESCLYFRLQCNLEVTVYSFCDVNIVIMAK